jgi:hypothetical protein
VFGRRHERQVQELEVVVGQPLGVITASGAVMTLSRDCRSLGLGCR